VREKTPTQLGPLERANLSHWYTGRWKSSEKFCEFCTTFTIVRILSNLLNDLSVLLFHFLQLVCSCTSGGHLLFLIQTPVSYWFISQFRQLCQSNSKFQTALALGTLSKDSAVTDISGRYVGLFRFPLKAIFSSTSVWLLGNAYAQILCPEHC
jgi:hypothetical protein